MRSHSAYFAIDPDISLRQEQLQVLTRLTACLSSLRPAFLEPADTSACIGDDNTLSLIASHAKNAAVQVALRVDEDGKLWILCDSLHRSFELCFNDVWEPDDCLGDLDTGVQIAQALFAGKVESRVVFDRSGNSIAKSEDYLVDNSHKPVKLYTQYHGQGIADAVLHRRCEIRRISFDEETGIEATPCGAVDHYNQGWWGRLVKRVFRSTPG